MSRPLLDEERLVLIAAVASATRPEEVLAATDIAALARVTAVIDGCDDDPLDVAAAALVGIAKERPFGADSAATAWLACALLAPVEAARVAVDHAAAVELVRQASRGDACREQVRRHLTSARTRCPACGRPLTPDGEADGRRQSFRRTPIELVARCAVEHRAHGRFGRPLREPTHVEDTPWRPVLANPRTGAMIVLADAAPLLLVPDGETYVVAEPTFVAGDLVGDWRALTAHAVVRTSVPAAAITLDDHGTMIDASKLDETLRRQRVPAFS